MRKLYFLLSLLLIVHVTNAQEPAILSIEAIRGNGADYVGQGVVRTTDGGGIVRFSTKSDQGTGNINTSCNLSNSDESVIFRKYDGIGNVEWEKCFPYNQDSGWHFLHPLSNGDIVLSGFIDLSTHDFKIRKEDAIGNLIWGDKYYGGSAGEGAVDVIGTSDGGFLVLAESNSNDGDVGFHYGGMFNIDIWVLKLDSNGNKLWSAVLGGTSDEIAFKALEIPGDGYYIVGATQSTDYDCTTNHGGVLDAFVARLNDSGQIIWTKCYGGSGDEGYQFGSAELDGQNLLLAVDASSGDGDVSNHIAGPDYWLVKIDTSGTILWDNCYNGQGNIERVYSVCKATDGTIWMNGKAASKSFIVHTDNAGNLLGSKTFVNANWNDGRMLLPLLNGTVLAGGVYEEAGLPGGVFPEVWHGVFDVYIAKFAPWNTSFSNIAKLNAVSVFPNPAYEKISINSNEIGSDLCITDITGHSVYRNKVSSTNISVDVSKWVKGTYFIYTASESSLINCTKIIVQ